MTRKQNARPGRQFIASSDTSEKLDQDLGSPEELAELLQTTFSMLGQ
jgi:hypothetical protein